MSETALTPYKARARRLGEALKRHGQPPLMHSDLLDIIAEVEGYASWAVLKARIPTNAPTTTAFDEKSPTLTDERQRYYGCPEPDGLLSRHAAQYFRLIGELIELGEASQEAIASAAEALPEWLRWVATQIRSRIYETGDFSESFTEAGFPGFIEPLLQQGVKAGKLREAFARIAHLLEVGDRDAAIILQRVPIDAPPPQPWRRPSSPSSQ